MPERPLISCLMVTLDNPVRQGFIRQAIDDYCAQTYERRELLIVKERPQTPQTGGVADFVAGLGRSDIRIIETGPSTLGALRNLSFAEARGEVCCQWDDDDLHHPERLERQFEAMDAAGTEAVGLQETMQLFTGARALYRTNWRATPDTVAPGTLMCRTAAPIRYPEDGPNARLGEDSAVTAQLLARGQLHGLDNAPHLYVYVSHGANSWDNGHHRRLADMLGVSKSLLARREATLRAGLSPFDFGPQPVTVRGPNGPAFVIEPVPNPAA